MQHRFFKLMLCLDVANVNVSPITIGRRLKAHGIRIRARVAAKKVDITELHAQQRLLFALDHVGDPIEAWDATIISDEKVFGYVNA